MEICTVDWPKFFASARDVFVSLSAAGTAYAAIRGLNTWRAQKIGQIQVDAALKLVRAAVATRDALRSARAPMIWAYEFPEGYRGTNSQEVSRGTSFALENRWTHVREAREQLDTARVECEAIWGSTVNDAVREMYATSNEWVFAARHHVQRIANANPGKPTTLDDEKEAILFNYQIKGDQFAARIDSAFALIEKAVYPALQQFRRA